ncbi:hypothetical protein [Streptomyces sp. NPDC060243]|uniref:hypothetical protein n=1 Tax=Streptomyces sp. NPDC060243 TaxID=3347081 RepID=UPI0036635763
MTPVLTTALAVLGTLLGATVTGFFQHLAAGRTERAAARARSRQDALDAVADLVAADSAHRQALRMRLEAKLSGTATDAELFELRTASHITRAATKRPYALVRLLVPDPGVKAAADTMITATYDMADAATPAALDTAQEWSRAAHDHFIDTAAEFFDTER